MIKIKTITLSIVSVALMNSHAQNKLQQYHKGIALFQQEKYTEAEKTFTQIINQDKKDASYLIGRGETFVKLKNYQAAISDFEKANELKANIADYQLAQVYGRLNDAEKSVGYLEKHLNSRYKLPESEIRLDVSFKNIENTNVWIQLWKNDWYSKKEKFIEEINYLNSNKKYFDALDQLDIEIKKNKKDHRLYALRAETYNYINNPKAAVANYNKAIGISKREPEYFLNRGKANAGMGNYKDAYNDFETAQKYWKDNLDLYIMKAGALNSMGKYQQAADEVIAYLELLPESPDALVLCGDIFFNNKQFSESVYYYSKVIELDASNASVYLKRGNCYFANQQYRKAFEDFSQSLDLDPKNPFLYLQRGNARLRIGDYSGACADWQKAEEKGLSEARKNILQFCQ